MCASLKRRKKDRGNGLPNISLHLFLYSKGRKQKIKQNKRAHSWPSNINPFTIYFPELFPNTFAFAIDEEFYFILLTVSIFFFCSLWIDVYFGYVWTNLPKAGNFHLFEGDKLQQISMCQ